MIRVGDVLQRWCSRKDSQPAERITFLELAQHVGRDCLPGDTVEAIASGNEIAVELNGLTSLLEDDIGVFGGHIHQLHVLNFVEHRGLAAVGGGKQVFLDLALPVRHEALADMFRSVDKEAVTPGPHNFHAVVREPLAVHAAGEPAVSEQFYGGLLKDPSANARQDACAAALLEHNTAYALQVKKLRQQQAGRAGANDSHLSFHPLSPLSGMGNRPAR